jgi:hypothetical protein
MTNDESYEEWVKKVANILREGLKDVVNIYSGLAEKSRGDHETLCDPYESPGTID